MSTLTKQATVERNVSVNPVPLSYILKI